MKKRIVKKLLGLVLAMSMILGMTACGSGGDSTLSEAGTQDAAKEEGEKTAEAGEEIALTASGYDARYFDEEGNMQLPLTDGSYTYKILWKKLATDVGTPEDKYMLQQALEATGIKVEIEEVSEQGWEEKLSVIFASGDLPDVIVGETNNTINFVDQLLDMTDLLPMYCPFMSDFYYNQYPNVARKNTFNGRLYSMSSVRLNGLHSGPLWAINTAWLDRVGMEIPTTTDELYEVLKAFKEQDANGNGDPGDEIPYSFTGVGGTDNVAEGILMMMNSFGMVNDGAAASSQYIMVEDDEVKFAPTDERFYAMLQYLNKLYSEGLVDVDGLIQERNDRYTKGGEDRIGYFTHGGLLTTVVGDVIGAECENILPPASEYGSFIKQNDPPAEMPAPSFFITKSCPNPELILMMCEYMNSTPEFRFAGRFGPEGGAWYWDENGEAANQTDFTGKAYQNRAQATDTLSVNVHFPTILLQEEEDWRAYVGFTLSYNTVERTLYGEEGGHAWPKSFPLGNDTAENSAHRSELLAEINTYIESFVAESMTTGIDDAKWQAHLSNCEKLNVAEYTEMYQNLYDSLNK